KAGQNHAPHGPGSPEQRGRGNNPQLEEASPQPNDFPASAICLPAAASVAQGGVASIITTQRCSGRGAPASPFSRRSLLFFRQPCAPIFIAAGASRLWR